MLHIGGRRKSEFILECLREIIDIAVSADIRDFRNSKTAVHQQIPRILKPMGDQILLGSGTETLLKQLFVIGKADTGHLRQDTAVKIRIQIMFLQIDDGITDQAVFAVGKIAAGIRLIQCGDDFIKIRHGFHISAFVLMAPYTVDFQKQFVNFRRAAAIYVLRLIRQSRITFKENIDAVAGFVYVDCIQIVLIMNGIKSHGRLRKRRNIPVEMNHIMPGIFIENLKIPAPSAIILVYLIRRFRDVKHITQIET